MKKLLFTFIILFNYTMSFAQVTLTQEQYEKLPETIRTEIESENKSEKIKSAISIGHEIGVAVNETLIAIEDSALRISESELGKEAIFLAKWKLLYKDIARLSLGILFFIIVSGCTIYGYKSINKSTDDDDDIAPEIKRIITIAIYAILTALTFAIMFG